MQNTPRIKMDLPHRKMNRKIRTFFINKTQRDLIQGFQLNLLSSLFHIHKTQNNERKIPLSYQSLETMETSVMQCLRAQTVLKRSKIKLYNNLAQKNPPQTNNLQGYCLQTPSLLLVFLHPYFPGCSALPKQFWVSFDFMQTMQDEEKNHCMT